MSDRRKSRDEADDESHDESPDAACAERVARVLRAPELFDDDFEVNLVAAIRAAGPAERTDAPRARVFASGWWRTPLTLRVSPVAMAALAAALILMTSVVTLRMVPGQVAPVSEMARSPYDTVHDTVHVVRFMFVGPATSVALVGDFNAWTAEPMALTKSGASDAWVASVPLPAGRHEYAFIVNGKRWVPDPFAPVALDEFGTNSSIINVGT